MNLSASVLMPEVEHLEAGALEHHRDQVLADVVDVALDRADDDLADRLRAGLGEERPEDAPCRPSSRWRRGAPRGRTGSRRGSRCRRCACPRPGRRSGPCPGPSRARGGGSCPRRSPAPCRRTGRCASARRARRRRAPRGRTPCCPGPDRKPSACLPEPRSHWWVPHRGTMPYSGTVEPKSSPAGVPCPARRSASRASGAPLPCSACSRMARSASPSVAARSHIPKSTAARLLAALAAEGAVEQVPGESRYRLGPHLIALASGPRRRTRDSSRRRARPWSTSRRELGEAAGLSVRDGWTVHYVDQVESPNPRPGARLDRHPDPAPRRVVRPGVPRPAPGADALPLPRRAARGSSRRAPSPTRPRSSSACARCAAKATPGCARSTPSGISSVAAPIADARGEVVAAVHVHGPSYRFPAAGAEDDDRRARSVPRRRESARASEPAGERDSARGRPRLTARHDRQPLDRRRRGAHPRRHGAAAAGADHRAARRPGPGGPRDVARASPAC